MNKRKIFFRQIKNIYRSSLFPFTIVALVLFAAIAFVLYAFEQNNNGNTFSNIFDSFWFAFVTLSTTGYGDIVPVTVGGRLIAIISVFLGIVLTSVLSGRLASLFVEERSKSRRGLMKLRKINNHLIICGWKKNMAAILNDILNVSNFNSEDIVIISNIKTEDVDDLRQQNQLAKLNFIRGDFSIQANLERAQVVAARKVMIFADTQISNITEIDAKTVMTALTVKSISRDTYVCAELLDKNYEGYLKQTNCDEIIYPRQINQKVVACSTATNGLSKIFNALLGGADDGAKIFTAPLPAQLIGKEYRLALDMFSNKNGMVLLGLMENTGTINQMKMTALREAQKTADISSLLGNLRQVKNLQINHPNIAPDEGYIINKNSQLIMLKRTYAEDGGIAVNA